MTRGRHKRFAKVKNQAIIITFSSNFNIFHPPTSTKEGSSLEYILGEVLHSWQILGWASFITASENSMIFGGLKFSNFAYLDM
jgi:hypothetical protein